MQSFTTTPAAALTGLVSQILVVEHQQADGVVTALPFYADGLPGIVFQQSSGSMYLNDKNRKLSSLFLYGQTIRPITLLPHGRFRMVVFLLYPSAINSLFGIRSNEVTDDCIDLRLLPAAKLLSDYQKLIETRDPLKQIEIISNYLAAVAKSTPTNADSIVHYALEHIIAAGGQASLRALRKQLNVTERTFERRFEQFVGVSPRLFSRICQFKSSMQQLDHQRFNKLSDIAYYNGFADQSHFIRSFRQFTGLSPLQYLRKEKD
ncbi:helix-turn-helix domain-containing protein [Flavitalea antarctica]